MIWPVVYTESINYGALDSFYKTVHYKTVLDIRRFKDGPQNVVAIQKSIDYIEK